MSDTGEFEGIFEDDNVTESTTIKGPTHHSEVVHRPDGKESLEIRMVTKHVLWGDHLWNAGRWLAGHFDAHPEEVQGKAVVELGAGAGLPSVVACLQGARCTVVTDYPDPELIQNLRHNLDTNIKDSQARSRINEAGFLWGAPVDDLLAFNGGKPFDLVILCDLLFNHSEHAKLLRSCQALLAPTGTVWCVFTHYLPERAAKDRKFLEVAPEYGFGVEWVGQHRFDRLIFEQDKGDPEVRRTCHITKLTHQK